MTALQRQTGVTESKQLLLFAFARQTGVTAYLKSKQLLLFAFALRSLCQYSMFVFSRPQHRVIPDYSISELKD